MYTLFLTTIKTKERVRSNTFTLWHDTATSDFKTLLILA